MVCFLSFSRHPFAFVSRLLNRARAGNSPSTGATFVLLQLRHELDHPQALRNRKPHTCRKHARIANQLRAIEARANRSNYREFLNAVCLHRATRECCLCTAQSVGSNFFDGILIVSKDTRWSSACTIKTHACRCRDLDRTKNPRRAKSSPEFFV